MLHYDCNGFALKSSQMFHFSFTLPQNASVLDVFLTITTQMSSPTDIYVFVPMLRKPGNICCRQNVSEKKIIQKHFLCLGHKFCVLDRLSTNVAREGIQENICVWNNVSSFDTDLKLIIYFQSIIYLFRFLLAQHSVTSHLLADHSFPHLLKMIFFELANNLFHRHLTQPKMILLFLRVFFVSVVVSFS